MSQAVSSAGSMGAQAFAATGNPWVAAGAAAVGFLAGRSAQKAQNNMLRQQLEQTKKQNELIIAETARGVSEINRQRTLMFLETNRALQHVQRQSGDASANLLNQYAAVDQVGANVLVAQAETERQLSEDTAMLRLNNEINNENLNSQIINLTQGGQSQLRDLHTELGSKIPGKYDTLLSLAGSAFDIASASRQGSKLNTAGATKTTNQSTGYAKLVGLFND